MWCFLEKPRKATAPRLTKKVRRRMKPIECRIEGKHSILIDDLVELIARGFKVLVKHGDTEKDFKKMANILKSYALMFGTEPVLEFLDRSPNWISDSLDMFVSVF